jgi:hypothetical protein
VTKKWLFIGTPLALLAVVALGVMALWAFNGSAGSGVNDGVKYKGIM